MIDAKDLTVRIGTRELIVDASFRVDAGMRIGLVGRNGAGKTTLTRLLAGGGATSGVVEATGAVNRRGTVGYLPQDTHEGDPSQTVRERILSVRGIDETIRRIRKAERDMAAAEGARQAKAMERYVRLDQEFTAAGGWAASAEAAQMAAALGLPERTFPIVGILVGHPAQEPQYKPRLPEGITVGVDAYPALEAHDAELAAYDERVTEYYDLRDASRRVDSFTEQIARMVGQGRAAQAPILDVLHRQRLCLH